METTRTIADTPTEATPTHRAIEVAVAQLTGQALISRSRAVDLLLDVFTSTDDTVVRDTVAEILGDIRYLNAVDAGELVARLRVVEAACTVELAFAGC